jgi:hypothetical protein
MTCDVIPGTPACNPSNQSTSNGRGFFNAAGAGNALTNMPEGYTLGIDAAIIHMGTHCVNLGAQPLSSNWTLPVFLMLSYDGDINAVEPMIPFGFTSGTASREYTQNLTYVQQTISYLPTSYTIRYNGTTGYTTAILTGPSNLCKAAFDAAVAAPTAKPILAPVSSPVAAPTKPSLAPVSSPVAAPTNMSGGDTASSTAALLLVLAFLFVW